MELSSEQRVVGFITAIQELIPRELIAHVLLKVIFVPWVAPQTLERLHRLEN